MLPQLRKRGEGKMILMTIDQHLNAAFHATSLLNVLRQFLFEVPFEDLVILLRSTDPR